MKNNIALISKSEDIAKNGTFKNLNNSEFADIYEPHAATGWDRELLTRFRALLAPPEYTYKEAEQPAFLRRQAD